MFRHGFAMLSLALLATGAVAHQPPANLHLVQDHWTAWDPPTSFPEGAKVYRITAGDTLWDLAGNNLGNPYLWPQIWERNPYVLDAHWIYPGDPLVMGIEVTPIDEVRAAAAVEEGGLVGEDDSTALRLDSGVGPPVALGSEDDIYCSGFIGDPELAFDRQIIGSEYQSLVPTLVEARARGSQFGDIDSVKIDLTSGDIVYLDGGENAGLFPGDLFTAVQPMEIVESPKTGKGLGRFYGFMGRVRVLTVQEDTAIAEIVHSCMPVRVGAMLQPFEPQPVPLARRGAMVGFNDPAAAEDLADAATILRARDGTVSLGQDHVVYLSGGAEDYTPGDILTIYRLNRDGLPPVVVGELGILAVHDSSSVGRILESRYTVRVGDRVVPKSR